MRWAAPIKSRSLVHIHCIFFEFVSFAEEKCSRIVGTSVFLASVARWIKKTFRGELRYNKKSSRMSARFQLKVLTGKFPFYRALNPNIGTPLLLASYM